jgi:hypothetical protein
LGKWVPPSPTGAAVRAAVIARFTPQSFNLLVAQQEEDPPNPLDDADLQALEDRLERLEVGRECFLCARSILSGDYTNEHVIPAWAQRRYDLQNQRLILLNDTSIRYCQMTVPCCHECNTHHLKSVEDSIAQTADEGVHAVRALSHKALFLWLGKILYGILYKELSVLLDRSDPASHTIVSSEFLNQYHMHRFLLQQARERVRLRDFQPGSIFVWPAQPLPDRRFEWDLLDNVDTMFIACRVGRVAMFGLLADGGAAQGTFEDEFADIKDLPLHPIQFRELAGTLSYASSITTRMPKYVVFEGSPHCTIQLPLAGWSMKPLFNEWDPRVHAKFVEHYTGVPYDQLFGPPDRVGTWLRAPPDGRPNFMDVRDHRWPAHPN